jgi:hypothetical protein
MYYVGMLCILYSDCSRKVLLVPELFILCFTRPVFMCVS